MKKTLLILLIAASAFAQTPREKVRQMREYARAGDKEKAFAILDELADRKAHPCRSAPEFRQFDYWLGEWDVEILGQKQAKSSIQLVLDDCVIFENYTDSRGYAGKSFSIYGLDNGAMTFRWDHDKSLNRMTFTKEGPDRVRQILETSSDGKTWSKTYDGLYIRRK